jgi:hypothetical protein
MKVAVEGCKLPGIRTVGVDYTNTLEVGKVYSLRFKGVLRGEVGRVESINCNGSFSLRTYGKIEELQVFNVDNIEYMHR